MYQLGRLLLVLFAIGMGGLYALAEAPSQQSFFSHGMVRLETDKGSFPIKVELAETPSQHERGLMFRKSMANDEGMLFRFPQTDIVNMWMQNTYIPLDMLFIDKTGEIVSIHRDAAPLSTDIISSQKPVQLVLELPAGSVERYAISIKDRVEIQPTE